MGGGINIDTLMNPHWEGTYAGSRTKEGLDMMDVVKGGPVKEEAYSIRIGDMARIITCMP